MNDTPQGLVRLCEAPDPETGERMLAMLAAHGIDTEWDSQREMHGLVTHVCVLIYVPAAQRDEACEVLRENGIDIESEDYRWAVAGYPEGEEQWLRYRNHLRWWMVLLVLVLAGGALLFWQMDWFVR